MLHEVVSVEPSTVLDEDCPVSNAGSYSTNETPTSSGGISKSPTPSRLSGIGKAGETGEENKENLIGTTTDPRHIIVTFNGEQLPIEVESSKTLFDLRNEILDRRDTRGIPKDGKFFFLLGKNVISKKLEKRHLIDDILENDIPVSLTLRSNLEEAVCYVENAVELVTPTRETIPRMPTKSVLQVEAEQPSAPVETAMQAQENEHDRESCTRLTWDDGLEQLNAFKFKFGHVDAPAAYLEENEPLWNFVKSIHESYKNIQEDQMNGNELLSNQRISELERMGFKLQVQVHQLLPWEQRFEKLRQHFRTHGSIEVPKDTTLGRWVKTQRYYFKTTSEGERSSLGLKRIGLLDSIGFDWRVDTNQLIPWEQRFEKLRQHFRTHGSLEVPKDTTLGRWVKTQRYYFKTTSEGEMSSLGLKRIGLLDSIGFDWRVDTNDEVTDHVSVNADQGRQCLTMSFNSSPGNPINSSIVCTLRLRLVWGECQACRVIVD